MGGEGNGGPDDLESRRKKINAAILDKVAEDPAFRQLLLDDPETAMRQAGVADEVEQIDALEEEAAEVSAHCTSGFQGCGYWSSRYYCPGMGWKFGPWPRTG